MILNSHRQNDKKYYGKKIKSDGDKNYLSKD